MPDDDRRHAREDVHEPDDAPRRTRWPRRSSSGSRARCSSTRTARRWCTSGVDAVARRRAVTSRDDERFTQCVDVTAVDHLLDVERVRSGGRRCRALRGGRELPVAPAEPSHPRDLRGRRRRPEVATHRRRVSRASRSPSARSSTCSASPSPATTTSRASSCPTTGSATRCARTTLPPASRSPSKKTPSPR